MNNSRYLREYDFSRFDLATRNGLITEIVRHGGGLPVAAHTIRYRLPVMLFSPYKVATRIVWWDEKFLYMEQKTITLRDGIVRTIGYSKITTSFKIDWFVKKYFPDASRPLSPPSDMEKWLEYLSLSSEMMKSEMPSQAIKKST